jgi:hypothetical protein
METSERGNFAVVISRTKIPREGESLTNARR